MRKGNLSLKWTNRGFEKFLIGSGQELYRGMKSVLLKTEIG